MTNLGIGVRLGASFAFVLAMVVWLSLDSISIVGEARDEIVKINEVDTVKKRFGIDFLRSVNATAVTARDLVLVANDSAARATQVALLTEFADSYARTERTLNEFLKNPRNVSPEGIKRVRAIETAKSQITPILDEVVTLVNAGDQQAAQQKLMQEAAPIFSNWLEAINDFIALKETTGNSGATQVTEHIDGFSRFAIVKLAVVLALAVIAAFLVTRSVSGPLTSLRQSLKDMADGESELDPELVKRNDEIGALALAATHLQESIREKAGKEGKAREEERQKIQGAVESLRSALSKMADGDLTYRIEHDFPEEYEGLRADFNGLSNRLSDTISSVLEASHSIHSGADEIGQASEDLARRTENQAATLEETAAALDEITSSVSSAASSARSVAETAEATRGHAETSGAIMESAVQAMQEISDSSSNISDIIGVIDDIAFQTNLLALNAGVEAARAGEAGRGFAVVASEVRALAQRSSDAARDIKQLITQSSQQVDNGVSLVGKTGDALGDIVSQINQIAALISEIAQAADEQSTSLAEINNGMAELDNVTQSNAAMVEEATAAGQLLRSDVSGMQDLVSFFKVLEKSASRSRSLAA